MSRFVDSFGIVKVVGRLKKTVNNIRKAIEEKNVDGLKEIFVQHGASPSDAEEFANIIISTISSNSDIETLKKNIVNFLTKRGAKAEEVEDAIEGLVTIIETAIKEVVKK